MQTEKIILVEGKLVVPNYPIIPFIEGDGTAPKYADQDKVNPGSVFLSGALMFEYLGWDEVAKSIYQALEHTIQSKKITYDFHRLMENATFLKTSEFTNAIISNLKS